MRPYSVECPVCSKREGNIRGINDELGKNDAQKQLSVGQALEGAQHVYSNPRVEQHTTHH